MKMKALALVIFSSALVAGCSSYGPTANKAASKTAAAARPAANKPVGITRNLMSITVNHNGKPVKIQRNQNNSATVIPAFAKTSRPCPPFCIQPIVVAPGVETLGEVEVINYLKKMVEFILAFQLNMYTQYELSAKRETQYQSQVCVIG